MNGFNGFKIKALCGVRLAIVLYKRSFLWLIRILTYDLHFILLEIL